MQGVVQHSLPLSGCFFTEDAGFGACKCDDGDGGVDEDKAADCCEGG
jgi:hypothetical protein